MDCLSSLVDNIILLNVRNLLHIPKHNKLTIDNVRYCLLGRVSHGLGTDTQVPIHAAGELLGAAWRINLAVAEWAIHKRTLQSVRIAAVGSDPH